MPNLSLNIYRAKDGFEQNDLLVAVDKRRDLISSSHQHGNLQIEVLRARPHPSKPKWHDFVSELGANLPDYTQPAGVGCAVLIRTDEHLYALTFGTGWHFIDRVIVQHDFGLRVCANELDSDELRTVDAMNFSGVIFHQRHQATRRTNLREFQLDPEQGILKALSGRPQDRAFLGSSISGSISINLARNIQWDEMESLLDRLEAAFRSSDYRERGFEWIDHISIVHDSHEANELDSVLISRLKENDDHPVLLTLPQIIELEPAAYRMTLNGERASRGGFVDDLSWSDYITQSNAVGLAPFELENIQNSLISCRLNDETTPRYKWSIYQCIYAELERDEEHFVLVSGQWYRIEKDFLARLDSFLETVEECSYLPDIDTFENEDDLIDQIVAASNGQAYKFHKKMISHGGGSGSVEFCDILHTQKTLVHAKRLSSFQSEPISHLFAQATVSAELILNDRNFREKVNEKAVNDDIGILPFPDPDVRPLATELVIVLVIADKRQRTNTTLPVFSRVNLQRTVKTLRNVGVAVMTRYYVSG